MSTRNIEDIYPLSPMQQGMLFHSLYAPESGVYVEQMSCTLQGVLDVAAFARAWQRLVDRHAVLRTLFVWEEVEEPLQVVARELEFAPEQLDWRELDAAQQHTQLEAYAESDRLRGFDLAEAPLMRITLIRLAEQQWRLIWTHHHLLIDGWSLPRLLQEVFGLYEQFAQGRDLALPEPRPFAEYIAWLQEQDAAAAEQYWRNTLRGFQAPTPILAALMPPDPAAAPDIEAAHEGAKRYLDAQTTAGLQALARQHGLTVSTLVQGAWAILLGRYTGESDVLFGVTSSGRPAELEGAENMIGLFINTLPVRVALDEQRPLIEWLQQLQAQQADLRQYEFTPLVQIQGWSEVPRGVGLFDSFLVFENYPVDQALNEQGGSLSVRDVAAFSRTNYPLTVVAAPGQELLLEIAYDQTRFDAASIEQLLRHFANLLHAMLADPQQPLGQLQMIDAAELRALLVDWNATEAELGIDRTVVQRFEANALERPQAQALRFQAQSLSYAELNAQANRLAHYLRGQGVGVEMVVGVLLDRSIEQMVAILGIMKAGAAYLPLDPDYPVERLQFMLRDAHPALVITDEPQLRAAQLGLEPLPRLLAIGDPALAAQPASNPELAARADNLAYLIYTSGSTGNPKGVLLQHRGLTNLVLGQIAFFELEPESRMLQFASTNFDASVAEIFDTLVAGATLVLTPRETLLSPQELLRLLRDEAISAVTLPPSLLMALPETDLPALKTLISAGERCSWEIVARWSTGRRFVNGYGPTETTVGPSLYHYQGPVRGAASLPIGRPVSNVRMYLLDQQQRPVPPGVAGEIYVGGVGVGRGYLNRPELTAERFVELDLPLVGRQRLYRTGDLARRLPEGSLEYLGRVDQQVKLRGFRIEPGEIESAIRDYPGVRDSVVIVREDSPGDQRLVAYLVPTDGSATADVDLSDLRETLRGRLPAHMLPGAIVVLNEFPHTPNGKIDRRALPVPEGLQALESYLAPRTPAEEIVAGAIGQVLGMQRVSADASFFELGGHSLLATQLVSRLREAFGIELPLRLPFEAPTVIQLAERVEQLRREAEGMPVPPITPIGRDGALPLSFAQQRLWFIDQLEPGAVFNNMPTALRLQGALDIPVLEQALSEIVRRHESLRTRFVMHDGQPVQLIAEPLPLQLPINDLTQVPADERETEMQRLALIEASTPFNLETGPLMRAQLLRLAEDDHVALLTLHHIISDGWSMGVLVSEIGQLYLAFRAGKASPLAEVPVQYADYAFWQRNWLQGETLQTQLDYWKQRLAGAPELLELPTDRPRPAVKTSNGLTYTFKFPTELMHELAALSRQRGVTMFMTLLAAFNVLLARYSGQDDLSVGTPIAGRTRRETEGLIGFFVNTLVIRTELSGNPSFEELLSRVREAALGAYAHQDLPFEMLVEALQPQRNLSHTPLFQVMFVMDNTPIGDVQLPGLLLRGLEVETGAATYDMTLSMRETAEGLVGMLEYNTDLFDPATIERLSGHFETLLQAIAADPAQPIAELPLLTGTERQTLLHDWNQTSAPFPDGVTFTDLFEQQVQCSPDAIAARFGLQQLSYAQLDARANQLAHLLKQHGAGVETLVGVCTERSLELVVSVLGALKAGAAFLPLDPNYPRERLALMVQDSQVPLILTQSHLAERLPQGTAELLALDTLSGQLAEQPEQAPARASTAASLAYVIYTSGSTGTPKGALLHHRGLCNLSEAQRLGFGVTQGDVVLQFSALSFDASVWELVMALRQGGTLLLAPPETLMSGPELLRLLQQEHVTTVTLPPSVLALLQPEALPELRTVIAAGERCTREIVSAWAPGRRFFNAYGPTETTVCASWQLADASEPRDPSIGRPLPNVRLYVVDRQLQPVPRGVAGELLVGGVGVARGYLNRAELNAERFVTLDLGAGPERVYRTGDLVRYRANGEVEFLGRIDQQVKVRGFRIELGEIEAGLRASALVQDAIVLAREDVPGDIRLVAYVVPSAAGAQLSSEPGALARELRTGLRERLPEYMVPGAYVALEAWPTTPAGKIDRKALPSPERDRGVSGVAYVAPRTELEIRLAGLCAELLGVAQVGLEDSFFELGGHSLLATQLLARVREALGVEVPLRALFEQPTVAGLAAQVEALREQPAGAPAAPTITAVSREGRRIKRSAIQSNESSS